MATAINAAKATAKTATAVVTTKAKTAIAITQNKTALLISEDTVNKRAKAATIATAAIVITKPQQ